MRLTKVPFDQTRSFSDFFLDYISKKESLAPFYQRFPSLSNFKGQITEKQAAFSDEKRAILSTVLADQYKNIPLSKEVETNIGLLKHKDTFTVTTGHQLNVFTGPLYFIYKIVTVVNACKKLKEQYPAYNFVPVYWMASEDHDYDEIKSFRLYGKKYSWNTEQTGAVGRFKTEGFKELLSLLPGDTKVFQDAYLKHDSLADAVRYYVNALFENQGVVVVDADDRSLKSLFQHVMTEDIFDNVTNQQVDETNAGLKKNGYEAKVLCRDINFFYLDNSIRSRIEKKGENYVVVDTDLSFTKSELEKVINEEPEKLSPNVILRPLYQETILPNLAYVGGPAELVYWLQLKGVFDHFKTPFPILMPRNFGLVIESNIIKKFDKTGLDIEDFFQDKNYLFNHWVLKNTKHNLTTGEEISKSDAIFADLRQRAGAVDKTLEQFISAERQRAINSLEKIEKKMLRAEKRVQKEKLGQIEFVKDVLFPNGNLQERTDNFLNFYQGDKDFINKLIVRFDPFDFQMHVLIYE